MKMQKFLYILLLIFISPYLYSESSEHSLGYDAVLKKRENLKIGIIFAHPKEMGLLLSEMQTPISSYEEGRRVYYKGTLWGIETVLAVSRIGKVAAATTATHLLIKENVDCILLLGTAGALKESLKQGDICIGKALIQHDLDSRPFIPQCAIPLLGITAIETDSLLSQSAESAASIFTKRDHSHLFEKEFSPFSKVNLKAYTGLLVTGDQFISSPFLANQVKERCPEALCVDMESAAIAQVCFEYHIPFAVIRLISDHCTPKAAVNCLDFMQHISPKICREILHQMYQDIKSTYQKEEKFS